MREAAEPVRLSTAQRTVPLVLLVVYVLLVAWILFWPSGAPATSSVQSTSHLARALGVSGDLVTEPRVEFALNVLMVAPLPFLAALVWPRWSWQRWTAYAFVASGCVEVLQGVFLPDRSAQFADVAANTLGALIGAVAAKTLARLRPVRTSSHH